MENGNTSNLKILTEKEKSIPELLNPIVTTKDFDKSSSYDSTIDSNVDWTSTVQNAVNNESHEMNSAANDAIPETETKVQNETPAKM